MVYTEKVQDVLQYIKHHPISVKSEKMFYVPSSQLDSSRLPDVVEGLEAQDVIIEPVKSENRVNTKPISKLQEHSADVTAAMLYLACGGMDEAHNIVLPYSWPQKMHISGPPISNSPAIKESEYCHALVHRKEGDILGELGMVGFNNCKFWFGKTGFHPLYETVKSEAIKNAEKDSECKVVQDFVAEAGKHQWDPDTFTDLCSQANKGGDEVLINYCNEVSGKEWNLLLEHSNGKANPMVN